MNKVSAFLVLLLAAEFYLFWRMDVAIKKSTPLNLTETTGRIRIHFALRIARLALAAGFLFLVFASLKSDGGLIDRLVAASIYGALAIRFAYSFSRWHEVCWDENGLEGYVYSWRYPIIPQHRKISWHDIVEVKKPRGGTILLGKNNRRLLAWTEAHLGYSYLNKHLAMKRPDLFYPPYYLEPIPRKK